MSMHHISADGQTIVCTAPVDDECRCRPMCDSETWSMGRCNDHDEEHPSMTGMDCWQSENIKAAGLLDSYADIDEQDNLTPEPGAAVDVEWEGDFTIWRYEEEA